MPSFPWDKAMAGVGARRHIDILYTYTRVRWAGPTNTMNESRSGLILLVCIVSCATTIN